MPSSARTTTREPSPSLAPRPRSTPASCQQAPSAPTHSPRLGGVGTTSGVLTAGDAPGRELVALVPLAVARLRWPAP
jgi:hypothetical protein